MSHNDLDICIWCSKQYSEHIKDELSKRPIEVGFCLSLKQGFVHKSQSGLRLTKESI